MMMLVLSLDCVRDRDRVRVHAQINNNGTSTSTTAPYYEYVSYLYRTSAERTFFCYYGTRVPYRTRTRTRTRWFSSRNANVEDPIIRMIRYR